MGHTKSPTKHQASLLLQKMTRFMYVAAPRLPIVHSATDRIIPEQFELQKIRPPLGGFLFDKISGVMASTVLTIALLAHIAPEPAASATTRSAHPRRP